MWQEKQFVEGYYTGGRIMPWFVRPPAAMGWIWLVLGTLISAGIIGAIALSGGLSSVLTQGFGFWLVAVIGLLQTIAGVRVLRSRQRQ